jgi:hypothetical protein
MGRRSFTREFKAKSPAAQFCFVLDIEFDADNYG